MIDELLFEIAKSGYDICSLSIGALAKLLEKEMQKKSLPTSPGEALTIAGILKTGVSLRVLLLGPGEGGGDIFRKRCEIRDLLRRLGHQVEFCEDVWTPAILARSGLNLTVAEYLQVTTYDYIICLMASPGSVAEVHDFAKEKKVAVKMMICVDGNHRGGYSAKGTLRIFEGYNGKLDWFLYPDDITKCHLARRVTEQIQKVAERKQWELMKGLKMS